MTTVAAKAAACRHVREPKVREDVDALVEKPQAEVLADVREDWNAERCQIAATQERLRDGEPPSDDVDKLATHLDLVVLERREIISPRLQAPHAGAVGRSRRRCYQRCTEQCF